MYGADWLVVCLGYFNEHAGRHINEYNGVHRVFGIGYGNLNAGILLVFCLKKKFCVDYMA